MKDANEQILEAIREDSDCQKRGQARFVLLSDYIESVHERSISGDTYSFSIRAFTHRDFTHEQRGVIWRSINNMIERLFVDERCVEQHGSTDRRSRDLAFPFFLPTDQVEALVINMAEFHSMCRNVRTGEPSKVLYIDHFSEDPTPVDAGDAWRAGNAEVNSFNRDRYLRIRLNAKAVGASSSFPASTDEGFWAGAIAHECLHNLGWRHLAGETAYIYAHHRCVSGDISFGLVDWSRVEL